MVPIYLRGGSFSSTPVPTLKKWATLLNTQLHLNFPEAITKIQDVFGKLAKGKKNSAKIQNTAEIKAQPDASQGLDSAGRKVRGASKSRLANSSTITTTTNTTLSFLPSLLTTTFSITARSGL
jgi:hypothetical protein